MFFLVNNNQYFFFLKNITLQNPKPLACLSPRYIHWVQAHGYIGYNFNYILCILRLAQRSRTNGVFITFNPINFSKQTSFNINPKQALPARVPSVTLLLSPARRPTTRPPAPRPQLKFAERNFLVNGPR